MKQVIDSAFLSLLEERELQIGKPMQGLFGGNRKSPFYGSSVEFADYREYTAGDDLRRIDWNLYARFEKLYLKLFVDERQLHHRIYIDSSASMDFGEEKKGHVALKIAAALGFLAVKSLDRVSFYSVNEGKLSSVSSTVSGREAFYRAAEELNLMGFQGECGMAEAFSDPDDLGGADGISVILSDFFSDDEWKRAIDALVGKKRQVLCVQILSRDEVDPQFSGKYRLMDSECTNEDDPRNCRFDVGRSTLKAYQEALSYHKKQIRDFCADRGVSFISVVSDENVESILFERGGEEGLIR